MTPAVRSFSGAMARFTDPQVAGYAVNTQSGGYPQEVVQALARDLMEARADTAAAFKRIADLERQVVDAKQRATAADNRRLAHLEQQLAGAVQRTAEAERDKHEIARALRDNIDGLRRAAMDAAEDEIDALKQQVRALIAAGYKEV